MSTQQTTPDRQFHLSILSFNGTEILLAKSEIYSVGTDYVFEKNSATDKHIGYISGTAKSAGKKINVYGFSSTLELLRSCPVEKPQCIIVRHARGEIAILCQSTEEIILNNAHTQTVPECMHSTNMPITHLSLYQDTQNEQKIAMITNADTLFNYILNYV